MDAATPPNNPVPVTVFRVGIVQQLPRGDIILYAQLRLNVDHANLIAQHPSDSGAEFQLQCLSHQDWVRHVTLNGSLLPDPPIRLAPMSGPAHVNFPLRLSLPHVNSPDPTETFGIVVGLVPSHHGAAALAIDMFTILTHRAIAARLPPQHPCQNLEFPTGGYDTWCTYTHHATRPSQWASQVLGFSITTALGRHFRDATRAVQRAASEVRSNAHPDNVSFEQTSVMMTLSIMSTCEE